MKLFKIFFVLSVLTIFSCTSISSPKITNLTKEKQYVLGTNDIPLFSGLELAEEDSTNFDTMLGNIVISKYIGSKDLDNFKSKSVKDFYVQTLPQLGWVLVENKIDKVSFKREKDKLEIRMNYESKGLYVRFFISSVLQ